MAAKTEMGLTQQEVASSGAAEEVLQRSAEVVQLFRRPGLSASATKTLLRKVCFRSIRRTFGLATISAKWHVNNATDTVSGLTFAAL